MTKPPYPPYSDPSTALTWLRRLPIAWGAFVAALRSADYATRVMALHVPADAATAATQKAVAPAPVQTPTPTPSFDAALQLLGLLQREARLIDFTQEDIRAYSDADIGAAARVVHAGCRKVLDEHFSIAPLRTETEGSRIRLEAGFDARAVRLTGNVVGSAPFQGSLNHRGWRATDVRMPQLSVGHDVHVLAQAEVEL
jgi:hypothetical protein